MTGLFETSHLGIEDYDSSINLLLFYLQRHCFLSVAQLQESVFDVHISSEILKKINSCLDVILLELMLGSKVLPNVCCVLVVGYLSDCLLDFEHIKSTTIPYIEYAKNEMPQIRSSFPGTSILQQCQICEDQYENYCLISRSPERDVKTWVVDCKESHTDRGQKIEDRKKQISRQTIFRFIDTSRAPLAGKEKWKQEGGPDNYFALHD